MHQLIYPALFCAATLFYTAQAACDTGSGTVQPLTSVVIQNNTSDWKQANQKVAELGGWQFYASEVGGHQGMDHSKHSMPLDDSKHTMPMVHSKHSSDDTMDHSTHSKPMEHSQHHNHQQMDHSEHQRAKTGDEHEHHH